MSGVGARASAMRWLAAALAGAGWVQAFAQDPTTLTATEAAAQIRKGQITSEALTRALLERAKAGKSLNAFITLDEEGALKAARPDAAKARRKPAHGVPVVIRTTSTSQAAAPPARRR
jgi:mandelamide amidase